MSDNPKTSVFWISFASEVDGRNIGVVLIPATDPKQAIRRSIELGLNPGHQGEDSVRCHVMCVEMPDTPLAEAEIERLGIEVFRSRQYMDNHGYELTKHSV